MNFKICNISAIFLFCHHKIFYAILEKEVIGMNFLEWWEETFGFSIGYSEEDIFLSDSSFDNLNSSWDNWYDDYNAGWNDYLNSFDRD